MHVVKMEDNNKSRPRRPLLIVSLFLFLTSILSACGGGGGGSSPPDVNNAPTINSKAATAATEKKLYSYAFDATDDDGDTLTLDALIKPEWLNFDTDTSELSGTPSNADVGDHDVTLRASDGVVDVDQSFVITVTNVNDLPEITNIAITAATEEVLYSYTFTATDIDVGDVLEISVPVIPTWLDFDIVTGALSGTPTNADVGDHDVTLRASDGLVDVDQSFVITVTNVNDAPEITSTAETDATEEVLYSYTFAATEVDVGDVLEVSAPVKPAWLDFDIVTGALSGTPTNADVGDHDVTLRASDGLVNVDQSFVITVTNVNDAPIITSGAAPSMPENTTAVTIVTATDDDGDTPTFSITGETADDALFSITADGVLTFLIAPDFEIPGDIDSNNIYNIEVTADDGNGGIAVQSIAVMVTDANDAPVFTSSAAPSVVENTTAVTMVTATDADSDTPTFSITGATADDALFSITAGGVLTFLAAPDFETPGDIGGDNVYDIEVTADDGNSGLTTQNIAVTVTDVVNTPVAKDDSATVNEDLTVTIDLASNDTGDALDLTSIATSAVSNGSISDNGDGTVDYTHDGSSTIQDSFTYTIDDANGVASVAATVNITVLQRFNEALYARPTVSSSPSDKRIYQANDGASVTVDNGWVANSLNTTDAKEWIELKFDSPKSIYQVIVNDRVDIGDQVESATIEFFNGDTLVDTKTVGSAANPLPDAGSTNDAINNLVFSPLLVDKIKVTIDTIVVGTNVIGLSEIQAFAALGPGQLSQKTDLFNDGDVTDWLVVDDCVKDTPTWALGILDSDFNTYTQTGKCRGFSVNEGVELGTYAILDGVVSDTFASGFLVKDMDLRLKLKSSDVGVGNWRNGTIGILFAYRSAVDYYRLDISQVEGHTKLWKNVGDGFGGSIFTELATSPQSLASDTWVNIRILRQNGVIVVYKDDVKIMAVEDNTGPLNGDYRIGLLCARNESCNFDTLTIHSPPSGADTPGTPNGAPVVGLNIDDDSGGEHTSGEYYVDTSGILDLTAVVTDPTGVYGIEFEVDGDAGNAQMDVLAPYTASFGSLTTGDHTVRAYLHGEFGRLSAAEATEELPLIGVSGIHLVGLGDSITGGLRDNDPSDDVSLDGRNTSGGYQPVLNDYLTDDNGGMPVTVLNEGNPGEEASEGAARIAAVLARTPAAQGYLAIYGANDSHSTVLTPSGLGLYSGEGGYDGSFKDSMQQIIDAVVGAGKAIYLAKTPPHMSDILRDAVIQEYNDVIAELIIDNGFSYLSPDFHAHFTTYSSQMFDDLHPNGTGYRAMAGLWCASLNGQAGISCSPP